MNQIVQNLETFELGGGIGDIGGEEIDLAHLDLTDTLLGSCAAELTQALGEPDLNVFEGYHIGDGHVSDIELTSFDSALIQDAGIQPYDADKESEDNVNDELAMLIGKKAKKEKSAAEKKETAAEEKKENSLSDKDAAAKITHKAVLGFISRCLAGINTKDYDKRFTSFINNDAHPWIEGSLNFGPNGYEGEADDAYLKFEDKDFMDDGDDFMALADAVCEGEFAEAIDPPKFELVK